jgi:ABC-type Mn2+/Zn2+ transport system permease subunit
VLSVGPLIAFGFLLIPALTAHMVARNMKQFTVVAPLIGGVIAFLGFCIAYKLDLPVGPTDVVLLGVLYASTWIVFKMVPSKSAARPT